MSVSIAALCRQLSARSQVVTSPAPWLDVTCPITERMVVWPGQPATQRQRLNRLEDGDTANVSVLQMSLHTGTHMDAPRHFFSEGDDITHAPPEVGMGSARVAQIGGESISRAAIEEYEHRSRPLQSGERILFRTDNSSRDWLEEPFDKDYVAVSPEAAQYLTNKGVGLVGVDYLSVAPFSNATDTHRILLGSGVWVIEGLDLRAIREGDYEMLALPLKIEGGDASPLRVLLRRT